MHETSLVRSLLHQVSELLEQYQGQAVETIRIEMGPLSGVERPLLELAFAAEVDATACRGAALLIEEVALTAVCQDCGEEFEVQKFQFVCRGCGSQQLRIVRGEDLILLDVVITASDLDAAVPAMGEEN